MNKKMDKADMVKRAVEKLRGTKIIIGGNRVFYKRKYHLKYTKEIVDNVLTAFLASIPDVLAEGDIIKLNGYMIIEPKYCKEKKNTFYKTDGSHGAPMIPARYKPVIRIGNRLKEACEKLDADGHKKENE